MTNESALAKQHRATEAEARRQGFYLVESKPARFVNKQPLEDLVKVHRSTMNRAILAYREK